MFDVKDGIQISKSVVINKDKDVFAKKVTASGGAVINTGSWNKDGLRLNGAAPSIYFSQDDGSNAYLGLNGDSFYILADTDSNGTYSSSFALELDINGNALRYFGHKVYHAGNDGPGSGLNADLLDGLDSTAFLKLNTAGGGYISTDNFIEAGRGSGGVSLTVNDGHGNANVTFNHKSGVPDNNGSSARIESEVDSVNGSLIFEVGNNVTAGTAVALTPVMTLTTAGATSNISHTVNGLLTLDSSDYGKHINLKRLTEDWEITPSTDGSLDVRRVAGTSTPFVDLPRTRINGDEVLTVASGKAVDADKLDGLSSSQFLRSDVSDTLSANLNVTGSISFPVGDSSVGIDQEENYLRYRFGSTSTAKGVRIDDYDTPVIELNRDIASDFKRGLKVSGNSVYHRGDKPSKADVGLSRVENRAFNWQWGDGTPTHIWASPGNSTEQYVYEPNDIRDAMDIRWSDIQNLPKIVYYGGANAAQLNDANFETSIRDISSNEAPNIGLAGDWYHVINMAHQNSNGYGAQIAVRFQGTNPEMRFRSAEGTTFGSWATVYHTANKQDHVPTLGSVTEMPINRNVLNSGVHTYGTRNTTTNAPHSSKYGESIVWGNGGKGAIELWGGWVAGGWGRLYTRALRNVTDSWSSWYEIYTSRDGVPFDKITGRTLAHMNAREGYWGLNSSTDGSNGGWIRTPSSGLLPYNSGISSSLGTSAWKFNNLHVKNAFMDDVRTYGNARIDGTVSANVIRNIGGTGTYLYGGDMAGQHAAIQAKYGEGEIVYLAAEGGVQILSSGDNLNNNGQAADTLTNDRRVVLCDSGGNSRFYQGTVTVDQIHAGNGQITPSAAKLQVNGTQRTGTLYLHEGDNPGPNTEVMLSSQVGGTRLRVTTKDGYIDVGPQNSSYAHLTTNLGRFYFNKEVQVNGDIKVYNKLSKFTADGNHVIVGANSGYFSRFTNAGKISRRNSGWANNSVEVDLFKSAWMSHLGDHILIRPTGNQVNSGAVAIGREAFAIGRNSYSDPTPNSWFDVFDVDTWVSLTASSLRFQGKEAFRYDDNYLRINKGNMFSSGVHFDSSAVITTGDMHARLFRSSYGTQVSLSADSDICFRVNNTNDNYMRFVNRVGFANYLEGENRFATKSTTKSNSLDDGAWIAAYVDANNRDHIWHDEGSNTWHFVSDSPFKAAGNSTLRAGGVISSGLSKFTGKVMFGGDGNHNNQNANLAISVGDADTGIQWNSDGDIDLVANNTAAVNITNSRVRTSVALESANVMRSTNYDVYTGDGRGIRFWNGSNSYKIYMSRHAGSEAGRIDPDSDYNMYFKMTSGNRGFVFKNNTNNFVHLTPNKSYFRSRMEVVDTANTVEPALLVQKKAEIGNSGAALLVASDGETTDIIVEGRANTNGTVTDVSGRSSTSTSGDMKFQIWASGNANFAGNVTGYGSASDITLKENIKPITNAVDKTLKLNGCTFNYIERPDDNLAGVIAQDVQKVMPELVYRTPDNKLAVRYGNMAGLFVEAIKELKTENDRLKSTLDDVLARLAALEGK